MKAQPHTRWLINAARRRLNALLTVHFLLCARRLASSKRLVVLAGASALGLSTSLGAATASRTDVVASSAPGKCIVTGRSVRKRSGLGSCAGPVRVDRT